MNRNHDNELEAQIDRELKSLPPLTAPSRSRARHGVGRRARRGAVVSARLQTWPPALRTVSMLVLLAAFTGVCLEAGSSFTCPSGFGDRESAAGSVFGRHLEGR